MSWESKPRGKRSSKCLIGPCWDCLRVDGLTPPANAPDQHHRDNNGQRHVDRGTFGMESKRAA